MQAFAVLRDSLYFFRCNLIAIARLCLPVIIPQALAVQLLDFMDSDRPVYGDVILMLVFSSFYTGALLVYLDARINGGDPTTQKVFAVASTRIPALISLAMLNLLIITASAAVLVFPGIVMLTGMVVSPSVPIALIALGTVLALWLSIRLSLTQPLLIVRSLNPTAAIRESFALTRGHFWLVAASLTGAVLPLFAFQMGRFFLPSHPMVDVLLDIFILFVQLGAAVVAYRLSCLLTDIHRQKTIA
ncbi:hypothetical protein [Pseudomonas sp. dw_358]|uniref:hypothetical protein n=1 Tax=Pseudomonas sp. dw_358 TaxID=2720083 RepID=UPI001BD62D9F|nr:hypothetical protein [Pseudomonas sp. dw_358]